MAPDRATARLQPPLSDGADPEAATIDPAAIERHKRAAARAAAELVRDGMAVGLGTGSTVGVSVERSGRARG